MFALFFSIICNVNITTTRYQYCSLHDGLSKSVTESKIFPLFLSEKKNTYFKKY